MTIKDYHDHIAAVARVSGTDTAVRAAIQYSLPLGGHDSLSTWVVPGLNAAGVQHPNGGLWTRRRLDIYLKKHPPPEG